MLPGIGGQRGSTRKLGLKRLVGGGGKARGLPTPPDPQQPASFAQPSPPLPRLGSRWPGVGREGAAGRRTAGDEAGCFGGACGPIRPFPPPLENLGSPLRVLQNVGREMSAFLCGSAAMKAGIGGLLPSFLPPFRRGLPLPSKESSPSAPNLPHTHPLTPGDAAGSIGAARQHAEVPLRMATWHPKLSPRTFPDGSPS